jgi:His/Glu/Gln/Arg/opine family amino acid ABC transporter permease subunit
VSFDLRSLAEALPELMSGLATTLLLVLAALGVGIVIGLVACAGKLLGRGLLYQLGTSYVALFRGLPETVLIFWMYYCGPLVFDVRLTDFGCAVATLSIIAGAYLAEIFRAGIEAVPRGQPEAARALGLSEFWVGWSVVAPQAIRIMIPAFIGFVTILLKNSALVSAIGVAELFYQASVLAGQNSRHFELLSAVGAIYFCLIFPLSMLAQFAERRLAARIR